MNRRATMVLKAPADSIISHPPASAASASSARTHHIQCGDSYLLMSQGYGAKLSVWWTSHVGWSCTTPSDVRIFFITDCPAEWPFLRRRPVAVFPLWNSLPTDAISAPSLSVFKNHLETNLLQLFFPYSLRSIILFIFLLACGDRSASAFSHFNGMWCRRVSSASDVPELAACGRHHVSHAGRILVVCELLQTSNNANAACKPSNFRRWLPELEHRYLKCDGIFLLPAYQSSWIRLSFIFRKR